MEVIAQAVVNCIIVFVAVSILYLFAMWAQDEIDRRKKK